MILKKFTKYLEGKLITITFSLTLIILLLVLAYQYEHSEKNETILELLIQIYGAFIATFAGIYISLNLSRKEDRIRDEKLGEKILLGSLKIIWSEININKKTFDRLLREVESMPRIANQLHDQIFFVLQDSETLKNKAFYGCISSGAINEISANSQIFNAIQHAYYNMELSQSSLRGLREIYKDYTEQYIINNPTMVSEGIGHVDVLIKNLTRTYNLISEADLIINNHLVSKGVSFSDDEQNIRDDFNY